MCANVYLCACVCVSVCALYLSDVEKSRACLCVYIYKLLTSRDYKSNVISYGRFVLSHKRALANYKNILLRLTGRQSKLPFSEHFSKGIFILFRLLTTHFLLFCKKHAAETVYCSSFPGN